MYPAEQGDKWVIKEEQLEPSTIHKHKMWCMQLQSETNQCDALHSL